MLTICVVYVYLLCSFCCLFFFSSRRRHTRCALVTGVQTCALPIYADLAGPIKALIEEEPSFGYRTVAGLLDMNKNTVQRIFQIKGWQVRKRAVGKRPRIEALPSVAMAPDQRWATDLCRIWGGRRSEEHTSELQSLMRISYAVFCLQKKKRLKLHRQHI